MFGKSRHLLAVAALALPATVLSGCVNGPTPYQPYVAEGAAGVHGGYSDVRISPDRYLVRFHGNDMTSRERVEGYLLYRAAELTVQNGFDWFMVDDRQMEHNVQTIVEPDPFYHGPYGYRYWRPSWGYYSRGIGWNYWNPWDEGPFWSDRTDVRTVEAFEASAEISLHKGPVPANEPRAMDARAVMARLAPTIQLRKGS
jgi:hypothetical protein